MPCGEAFFQYGVVTCRVHGQREVLPDRAEVSEKFLRATRVAKAAHLALAPARWLVAILGAVVHASSRFDEDVLYLSEFRNLSLRRRITAQLIGSDLARHRA
ncbi:hypothetical protein PTKU46_78360 [Paraburkholderia terrae]